MQPAMPPPEPTATDLRIVVARTLQERVWLGVDLWARAHGEEMPRMCSEYAAKMKRTYDMAFGGSSA